MTCQCRRTCSMCQRRPCELCRISAAAGLFRVFEQSFQVLFALEPSTEELGHGNCGSHGLQKGSDAAARRRSCWPDRGGKVIPWLAALRAVAGRAHLCRLCPGASLQHSYHQYTRKRDQCGSRSIEDCASVRTSHQTQILSESHTTSSM